MGRVVPSRAEAQTNTDPAYDLDDPAKPGEVPVLAGWTVTRLREDCGVTSDRQRCSCRRACVQVEKQTTWPRRHLALSTAGATDWGVPSRSTMDEHDLEFHPSGQVEIARWRGRWEQRCARLPARGRHAEVSLGECPQFSGLETPAKTSNAGVRQATLPP